MSVRGRFIALEGGEGTGKSTQATRLADWLRSRGRQVIITREPGGTREAEALRELLMGGSETTWRPLSQACLFNAARHEHLEGVIRPALQKGTWVISDRFALSTEAYQSVLGVDPAVLARLRAMVVRPDEPDLTLLLDMDVTAAEERRRLRRGAQDPYEEQDRNFHERLRERYLELAEHNERTVVIPAAGDVESVHEAVAQAVFDLLETER